MIRRVQLVTVWISDHDRAIEFFCDKLGFELLQDTPYGDGQRWVEVAPVGGETALTLAVPNDLNHGEIGAWQPAFFACDDIDGEFEELISRGVEFTGPVIRSVDGPPPMAFFKDDDNNQYLLVERPLTAREVRMEMRDGSIRRMPGPASG